MPRMWQLAQRSEARARHGYSHMSEHPEELVFRIDRASCLTSTHARSHFLNGSYTGEADASAARRASSKACGSISGSGSSHPSSSSTNNLA
mmetsp:Transcript_33892/g.57892  ORF Transcript_33892/g.57892 Transcript_33892/m.57892 type:complete len:91 (-) Transcript_33892:995-1267(-)